MALNAMDMYGFYTGQIFDAYEFLGAHAVENGTVFRTFAPSAKGVCVRYGEEKTQVAMAQSYDGNFYEVYIPGVTPGTPYEYRVYTQDGGYTDHCDPYGFGMELRPAHRSIVRSIYSYTFEDSKWMKQRTVCEDRPLNIYEMHFGSWHMKCKDEECENGWYHYDELAEELIAWLKESGYNYVEFLPLSEHPCDESWGYQNTGFFAPTSRYGTNEELMHLIDLLHQNGIGAILDFVPVHFAVDAYGLVHYDGTALYEYPHGDVGVSEWGSYNFMHSRGEVRSFLQSAANYWLKEYHFDGIRMDAISRIIYWQGDPARGVNGNAVDFLKVMNRGLKAINPGCMLIAEDSTNYPGVTRPADQGGLGFDYKWDMGWMHDTLEYFQAPPELRTEQYHKLTFSMMYYWNERYLLPYSHDEVVHGKATILQKMNGEYDQKFPQGRAMYLYMMVHPGKKMNFMGNEIGQLREWDEKREQDWDLLKYPLHDSFYHYMKELNELYLAHSAFYEEDYENAGFEWLDCHQEEKCVYAVIRRSKNEQLAALFNFGNTVQEYTSPVLPGAEKIRVLLDSDWQRFSGDTVEGEEQCCLVKEQIVCTLPPFSGILLQIDSDGKE